MINWHRLFGVFLIDYFSDSPYEVELEKDLSLQQQFLDIVILRKEEGEYQGELPDGLDNLSNHNLLSYKSMHESFDAWAMLELIGHYVNYRKQLNKPPLTPESEFSLYAISTRFPQGLDKQITLTRLQAGVYELNLLVKVRLIVLSQIETSEHNTVWHLFSHVADKVKYGAEHYHHKLNKSSVVNQLYEQYKLEGLDMPYTLEDFEKDYTKDHLHFLTAEERVKGLSTEERVEGLSTDERVEGLSIDERLKGVSEADRLKGLSKDALLDYLKQLENQNNDDTQH